MLGYHYDGNHYEGDDVPCEGDRSKQRNDFSINFSCQSGKWGSDWTMWDPTFYTDYISNPHGGIK